MPLKINLIRVLSISLMTISFFGCQNKAESIHTTPVVLEQKEIVHSKQLKDLIIKEAANLMDSQDTIYLVTQRILPICGNDDRYDSITTPEEAKAEENYIKENPYYIDNEKGYEPLYKLDSKIIVTGTSFENEFNSINSNFKYPSQHNQKKVYDISYRTILKDTVQVLIYDYYNNDGFDKELNFVLMDGKWKMM